MICSAADCIVPARGKAVVPTDLAIAIPPNTYARVAPRSGLAVKHFIDTAAGVVDEDYRGAVGVVLYNHGSDDFIGQRVASTCCAAAANTSAYLCPTSDTSIWMMCSEKGRQDSTAYS